MRAVQRQTSVLHARRTLFSLPAVSYAKTGLPPAISPQAMDLHLNKHHQNYVNNANKLITGTPHESATLEQVIKDTHNQKHMAVLFNNVAQVYNHSFFWDCMSATKSEPSAAIVDAMNLHFGGLDKFREKFSHNALAVFGSGWTWLVDNDGQLEIVNTSNAGTPITLGPNVTPLLTIDVWEHAYYVDHQNRRADFVKAFWEVCNWNAVDKRYKEIKRTTFE